MDLSVYLTKAQPYLALSLFFFLIIKTPEISPYEENIPRTKSSSASLGSWPTNNFDSEERETVSKHKIGGNEH